MRITHRVMSVMATGLVLSMASALPALAERRPALSLLRSLTVAAEQGSGYDRALFPHWRYIGDGCDTRDAVLIRQAVEGPEVGPDCRMVSGRWFSAFDGVTVTISSSLDVDHLVPLAEAWGSGARRWSTVTRTDFANDLGYRRSLIAVTASSNRSKGDQDPAEWLPPRTDYRCRYVSDWIGVKYRWGLSVDSTELSALRVLVTSCGNPRMTVPARAR